MAREVYVARETSVNALYDFRCERGESVVKESLLFLGAIVSSSRRVSPVFILCRVRSGHLPRPVSDARRWSVRQSQQGKRPSSNREVEFAKVNNLYPGRSRCRNRS